VPHYNKYKPIGIKYLMNQTIFKPIRPKTITTKKKKYIEHCLKCIKSALYTHTNIKICVEHNFN